MKKIVFLLLAAFFIAPVAAQKLEIEISQKYLNLPVSHQAERNIMTISTEGAESRSFKIRLADGKPDYWVFGDMTDYMGKTITIDYNGPVKGLDNIYQSDDIAGTDSIYIEKYRPQVHFSTRRGWINDPNGLVFYDGEYHLFYQHNPYESEWENMHWGHAVSRDLIHWEELPVALYPDKLGTMYSGSAVIDYKNTSGFGSAENPAMVAIYTAAGEEQTQCVAYSLDKGRTWTKYDGNPVIRSKARWDSQDTRDPKVFRHEPTGNWVMVLNERDGHSIYTSPNLKEWTYQSHITGFWECPDLFELEVDGDGKNKKWVMYGASGTYMIGSFDGKVFMPEAGKYYYVTGTNYAAQTYSNIPASDGRRIQIGWSRISRSGMPFNGMMLLPVELTLKNTREGVRLFSNPVWELESLKINMDKYSDLTAAETQTILNGKGLENPLLIKITFTPHEAVSSGISLNGQNLVNYDLNSNQVNGVFYTPEIIDNKTLSAEILIDRMTVEVWIDGGKYSYSLQRRPSDNDQFRLFGNKLKVDSLEISELRSIW